MEIKKLKNQTKKRWMAYGVCPVDDGTPTNSQRFLLTPLVPSSIF